MKKGLNSFQLKCITLVLMITGIYMQQLVYNFNEASILAGEQLSASLTLTYNMGYLVYLAGFPLAAFLLVEAAKKTSDRKKLLLRLFGAALVVEIPMDMATFGLSEWKSWGLNQNYFFTLCIGLGVIMAVEALAKKYAAGTMANTLSTLAVYLLAAFLAILCRTEQSSIGVLMIVTLFLFYGNKMFSLVSVAALYLLFVRGTTGLEFVPALSVLFIWLYNGEPGSANKWTRGMTYLAFPVAYCTLGVITAVL